jgi:pyruvate-ferredoxin/flavodoxin oxidoreductase
MKKGMEQEKLAVASGHWPLYRYNPDLIAQGKSPFILDSKAPSIPLSQYAYNETRYRMLLQSDEKRAEALMQEAQAAVDRRWNIYRQLTTLFQPAGQAEEPEA